ncbi:MAG: OmcA/MtrC family decaheme c-type cytochrome [Bryobacteraceae bacterium]
MKKLSVSRLIQVSFGVLVLGGALLLTSATQGPFTVHDKAFYASNDALSFVRPGLVVKVLSAAIATDGTVTAKVSFADPKGVALDIAGITTPGTISNGAPGMIVAYVPAGGTQFTAYTTRTQTSPITKVAAIQAGTDSGGVWTPNSDGTYNYAFKTKATAGFDANAVHAVGVYGARNLIEFDMGTQLDDDVYYFVPATGAATTNPRDEIRTATCQKCHGPNMAFHGETGRSSIQMCDLCHTPQTTDPDTGNTVDMKVMVHKIHYGENLPSVKGGKPYQIIGFGQSVTDWSTVAFPSPTMKCDVCHVQNSSGAAGTTQNTTGNPGVTGAVAGLPGTMAANYLTNPSRDACGSCHDDVNFATGENHVDLPQLDDKLCKNCHTPQGELEFDASIKGAHTVPQESTMLTGLQYAIVKVDDGSAGKKPTVTFSIKDKNGVPLAMTAMNRIALTLAGPTTDYTDFGKGYIQEDVSKATGGANGVFSYTFTAAIPATAKGTYAVGIEGRRVETVLAGTKKERSIQYGATNAIMYFSVDGTDVVARRTPTGQQNCQGCHYRLSPHGENRVNNTDYCVFCHNPVESDAARRPAAQLPAQTVDLKFLAHRIHGGEELHTFLGTDYAVYGFGGSVNSFAEVRYPGGLNQCFMCHTNGSENPGVASSTMSNVTTARYPLNPTGPITTACYGCHDNISMLSHALTNTSTLGEACTTCHSATAEFAPTKMHAAATTVSKDQAQK